MDPNRKASGFLLIFLFVLGLLIHLFFLTKAFSPVLLTEEWQDLS